MATAASLSIRRLPFYYYTSFLSPGGTSEEDIKRGGEMAQDGVGGTLKVSFLLPPFQKKSRKKHFMASNTGTATVSKFFLFFLFNPEKERKIGTIEMPRPFRPAPKRHKRRLPIKGGDP